MSVLLKRAAIIGGAGLAALAIGMASSSAATTFTVKAGNAAAGAKVAVKGATTGTSPQISFTTSAGVTLNCTSGSAAGSLKAGTGLSGTKLGTIKGASAKFNTCTGPFNLQFTVTGSGTWSLNATSGSASGAAGTLTGIQATVDGGSSCKFSVTGSVDANYVNSSGSLVFPGATSALKIANVQGGCFGAVQNGQTANYKASYKLTATKAAFNPITVTSP